MKVQFYARLCRQTDDSWSEKSTDKDEEDWLLRELTAALDGEQRKVRFDPYMSDTQLLKLIDDELFHRPQVELQRRPGEYVDDYVSRLHRFTSNIDYFLNS